MPRIKSKKKEYMAKDIGSWISGKMREAKVSQATISKELGITQQAFSYKLFQNSFTYRDLITVFKAVNATDDEILKVMKV
ncbi:MAG: hypothetical protein KBT03_09330 [Bacteroidales bacterium]|nr:hypothetical protein [Candidatus Scybalousia scybalohippi]